MLPRSLLVLGLILSTLSGAPVWAADEAKGAALATDQAVDPDAEDFQKPPPGPPEDQALWETGRDAGRQIRMCRSEAVRLQQRVRSGYVLERLEKAAAGRPEEESKALLALRQRVKAEWKANHAFMAQRWPVNTVRGCGYPVLAFESAMRVKAAKGHLADMTPARTDLKACIEKASGAVKGMTASNQTFSAALDEAVKKLAELEPPPPPRPDPAAAAAARRGSGPAKPAAKQAQQ